MQANAEFRSFQRERDVGGQTVARARVLSVLPPGCKLLRSAHRYLQREEGQGQQGDGWWPTGVLPAYQKQLVQGQHAPPPVRQQASSRRQQRHPPVLT